MPSPKNADAPKEWNGRISIDQPMLLIHANWLVGIDNSVEMVLPLRLLEDVMISTKELRSLAVRCRKQACETYVLEAKEELLILAHELELEVELLSLSSFN